MEVTMETPREELCAMYDECVRLWKIKSKPIPHGAFTAGRKPTINDILLHPDSLINLQFHPQCQLVFYLANYNIFAAAGFMARKLGQDIGVTLAIFYWQLDRYHSFDTRWQEMRWNVLLASIVVSTPGARALHMTDPIKHGFLNGFVMSWAMTMYRTEWVDTNPRDRWIMDRWLNGPYDLIRWNDKQRPRMVAAVKSLEALVPPIPFDLDLFWTQARTQSEEEFKEHGAAWAIQYVIHLEKAMRETERWEKQAQADKALAS